MKNGYDRHDLFMILTLAGLSVGLGFAAYAVGANPYTSAGGVWVGAFLVLLWKA